MARIQPAEGMNDGTDPKRHEAIHGGDLLVHDWRAAQLMRLGVPAPLAEIYADDLDWHQMAGLVRRGCPVRLALRIVR